MQRRIDPILTALAGLACIAIAMFVASYYWYGECIVWRATDHNIRLLSNHGGFCLQRIDPDRTVYPAIFDLPYIVPAFVFALAAAAKVTFRRVLAEKRRRAGRCVACGYDIRATRDRCPECGTCPSQSRAAAEEPANALDGSASRR
jgi:hypothetical protein